MNDKIVSTSRFTRIHDSSEVTRCSKIRITESRRGLLVAVASLFIALSLQPPLLAQSTSEQRLTEAYKLERQGKAAPAITLLNSLLDSGSLESPSTAKAWNILGLALEDKGDFVASRRAFEQSLQTYEGLSGVAKDYAMAFDDFADLSMLTGQPDAAERMMEKALQLYESAGDHAGVTRASNHLTGLFFNQKKVREGSKHLDRAVKESHLTRDLDDDDLATLTFLEGWRAEFNGDSQAAASKYQQSLELLRKYHGEDHPSTGWAYVILGKADAENGDLSRSLADMRKGVAILGRTLSNQDPRFLTAELAYSRVLDAAGERSQSQSLRSDAEGKLRTFQTSQCAGCTVSVESFR